MSEYIGIAILAFFAFATASSILILNGLLGPKGRQTAKKSAPYECGVTPFELPEGPRPIKFFITAILFLIFDAALAFLYLWANAFRDFAWVGLTAVTLFLLLLSLGLAFAWRKGGLEWK